MSSYIGKLQVDNSQDMPLIGSTLYGTCSTAAATPLKEVVLAAFDTLISGVTVHVKFVNGNSAEMNSSFMLKVASTSPKEISNPGGSAQWSENSVISFTYDGTLDKWMVNDGNVSSVTILNTYDSTSQSGISGQGVAAALATLGAAAQKGVDTNISTNSTDNSVPTSAAVASYVGSAVNTALGAAQAMVFKGTIGSNANDTIATVPTTDYKVGWTYRVTTAGSYAEKTCEVGDLLIAITDATAGQSTVNTNHWTVAQGNIDSGLFKGDNTFTNEHVLVADGGTGKVKDSGFTIGTSVPANAVFTDTNTTYTATANTTINYLQDGHYIKSASVVQGVLQLTTVASAPTITPVTAITADT